MHLKVVALFIAIIIAVLQTRAAAADDDGDGIELLPIKVSSSLVVYEKGARNAGSDLGDFEVNGTVYDGACTDIAQVTALYAVKTRTEFTAKLQELLAHFKSNPGVETTSCFSYMPEKDGAPEINRFMVCTAAKCACNTVEPYKSTLDSSTNECVIDSPKIGSPCDPIRGNLIKRSFYDKFRERMSHAKKLSSVRDATNAFLSGFDDYQRYDSLPSDRRLACFHVEANEITAEFNTANLECSAAGECQCLKGPTNFRYVDEAGKCVAETDSICYYRAIAQNTAKEFKFSDTTCSSASGATCGTMNGIAMLGKSGVFKLTACGHNQGLRSTVPSSTFLPIFIVAIIGLNSTQQ